MGPAAPSPDRTDDRTDAAAACRAGLPGAAVRQRKCSARGATAGGFAFCCLWLRRPRCSPSCGHRCLRAGSRAGARLSPRTLAGGAVAPSPSGPWGGADSTGQGGPVSGPWRALLPLGTVGVPWWPARLVRVSSRWESGRLHGLGAFRGWGFFFLVAFKPPTGPGPQTSAAWLVGGDAAARPRSQFCALGVRAPCLLALGRLAGCGRVPLPGRLLMAPPSPRPRVLATPQHVAQSPQASGPFAERSICD